MEPVKTNDLPTISAMVGKSLVVTGSSKDKWECETCMKLVPANQFREHKSVCLEKSFQVSFPSKTVAHQVQG